MSRSGGGRGSRGTCMVALVQRPLLSCPAALRVVAHSVAELKRVGRAGVVLSLHISM